MVPLQSYESEIAFTFAITVFAMIVMVVILTQHFKDLPNTHSKVFPFIALTLTPLIMLHVFIVDVNLAVVVKLLIKRLF